MTSFIKKGNIADFENKKFLYGTVEVAEGRIKKIIFESEAKLKEPYILPGFIDSHVHIESSMLVPAEFAKLAVVHGTVATISDPHEIANVCGMEGVKYMIDNGKKVPFKFNFGAPSCVPATSFETAGSALNATDVEELLQMPDIKYLSEMMNFPGVLNKDEEVFKKIAAAKKYNKPVDGHAPGLTGIMAKQYIDAGISTDHECFTAEEALSKLHYGMKILIREGSAARNFDALADLLHDHSENMMFCSDDKHPDSLAVGHINSLCARAVARGIDIFKVLQVACINPVLHYKIDVGLLKEGDFADMVIVKDLINFEVIETYINGQLVAENGRSLIATMQANVINSFNCKPISVPHITAVNNGTSYTPVIEAYDGQLITGKYMQETKALIKDKVLESNTDLDIIKIIVVNRYKPAKPAVAFIKNTGLKKGALASSVAHDSHNIVAIGTNDEDICRAVNLVITEKGGISAVGSGKEMILALPVAGLMSDRDGYEVASDYTAIDKFVKEELQSTLAAPFMTLSFMALLVIPQLKLSDKGLFDGSTFSFVNN